MKHSSFQYASLWNLLIGLIFLLFFLCIGLLCYPLLADHLFPPPVQITSLSDKPFEQAEDDFDRVRNGVHVQTGLVFAEGFQEVRATCTACHSAKLVTQNRATKSGWKQMIVWMQETQGLWDLGDSEEVIIDYLAKHYAPQEITRRANLDLEKIEWFILEEE